MKKVFSIYVLLLFVGSTISAQLVRETYLAAGESGLRDVIDIANAGDNTNRLFFVEQDGDVKVHLVGTSEVLPTQFLNLSVSCWEPGENRTDRRLSR